MSGSADQPLKIVFKNQSSVRLDADTLQEALRLPVIAQIASGHKAEVTQDGDSFIVTYATLKAGEPTEVVLGQHGRLSLTYAGGDQSILPETTSPPLKAAARVIASVAAMNVPGARADT